MTLLIAPLLGCEEEAASRTITATREIERDVPWEPVPSSERFGYREPFSYQAPPGWVKQPNTAIRLVNFTLPGNAECYLGTSGGDLAGNVNRWRKQMGLAPLPTAEALLLPRRRLLGGEAARVDVAGTFTDMQKKAHSDWRLVGLIAQAGEGIVFIKMIGPAEAVVQQLGQFEQFCDSLRGNT